jgi:hypothetical protein
MPAASESNRVQIFGILCPVCKQFVPAGKVYIEAQAPPAKLHAKLQETGWNKDWLTCENPKCGSRTLAVRDQTVLEACAQGYTPVQQALFL